jgi:hypothetical protein
LSSGRERSGLVTVDEPFLVLVLAPVLAPFLLEGGMRIIMPVGGSGCVAKGRGLAAKGEVLRERGA